MQYNTYYITLYMKSILLYSIHYIIFYYNIIILYHIMIYYIIIHWLLRNFKQYIYYIICNITQQFAIHSITSYNTSYCCLLYLIHTMTHRWICPFNNFELCISLAFSKIGAASKMVAFQAVVDYSVYVY